MQEESQGNKKTARDPQALTSEYHKARKQLLLWSAILFTWSLIGIDLEKAKEAGGNTAAIIKSLKSPQAVPWALLTIVAYFVFKLRIEWRQCNEARRRIAEAKLDYYSACIVAGIACLLYIGQTISQIQFANVIQSKGGIMDGLLGSATITLGLLLFRFRMDNLDTAVAIFLVTIGIAIFVMTLLFRSPFRSVLAGIIVTTSLWALGFLLRWSLRKRKFRQAGVNA